MQIRTPLDDATIEGLRPGDWVTISGVIYAARDAAHKRMVESLDCGESLPFDARGQVLYYMGPTPAKPGRAIGSAGPTTSYRMDPYAPRLLEQGIKGMIGKGARAPEVSAATQQHRAVYFAAIGGAGALCARTITSAEIVAYEDLGPEALRRLHVEDLRIVVVNDVDGGDAYEDGLREYGRRS